MAQDTPTEDEPVAAAPEVSPAIQEALDAIRSEAAAREAEEAAAAEAEDNRVSVLNAAKANCTERCGPIAEVLAGVTDPRERQALIELEARTHADHADDLAAAYQAFSGQREGESNPAGPGVTNIESHASAGVEAEAK